MVKPKVVNGFSGYMKQFAEQDLNGLKPDSLTATSASYFFKNQRINTRKGKIIRNYISRSSSSGRNPALFNVEELATLWHFPLEMVVKAPMIQKAPGRKAEPPMSLPMFEDVVDNDFFVENGKDDIFSEIDKDLNLEKHIPIKQVGFAENKNGNVVDISNLGMENIFEEEVIKEKPKTVAEKKGGPPSNLPFG
jgi:hypothetical protein